MLGYIITKSGLGQVVSQLLHLLLSRGQLAGQLGYLALSFGGVCQPQLCVQRG